MTIQQKHRRSTVSDFQKKERIKAIINVNPAIKASIQDLADHDQVGDDAAKRNRAVLAVYLKNSLFLQAVDAELDR